MYLVKDNSAIEKMPNIISMSQLVDKTTLHDGADMESEYRRGYRQGFAAAVQHMEKIKDAGYSRSAEMINMAGMLLEKIYEWSNSISEFFPPDSDVEEWKSVKKKIIDEFSGKCAECGSDHELHIHHIVPVKDGGVSDIDNLVVLCAECHKALHSRMKRG